MTQEEVVVALEKLGYTETAQGSCIKQVTHMVGVDRPTILVVEDVRGDVFIFKSALRNEDMESEEIGDESDVRAALDSGEIPDWVGGQSGEYTPPDECYSPDGSRIHM